MEQITDICELSNEDMIIPCLEHRYSQNQIYTNVAKVLLAVNPYRPINELYSEQKIKEYHNDIKNELHSHLYSIANRVLLNVSLRPQSIVLTGETGSGKTKSAIHLLSFISMSSKFSNDVIATNTIFEKFGNAKTCYNVNSSRYTKLTEVILNADQTLSSIHTSYVLLESSRVYAQNEKESNFHIFYTLLSSAEQILIKHSTDLHLDTTTNYAYLSDDLQNDNVNLDVNSFQELEKAMTDVGMSNKEWIKLYKILAAILHLGNVILEENPSGEGCVIVDGTRSHLKYAAHLLDIEEETLKTSLLTRTMELKGSNPIVIQLDPLRANKVRNSLSQSLYEYVFKQVVDGVNNRNADSSNDSTFSHISLLDIAGFESFNNNNHFEQLCINFINEKIQRMFVKIMLEKEEEWYASENLEVPKIKFLDNNVILDVYEDKCKGIFKVLDDTIKMQCQTTENFVQNIFVNWANSQVLTAAKPVQQTGFIIRHFVGDVFYNVDNFVEKNANILTKAAHDICQSLGGNAVYNKFNGRSSSYVLKTEINQLIRNIDKTECSFVRCVKPNDRQCSGVFDRNLVRSQLISSGSIAYQQLMKIGFPSNMSISNLFNNIMSKSQFMKYTSFSPKEFCNILLRSCSLKWTEFKLGNTQIFFRNGKLEILSEKLREDPKVIIQRLDKLMLLRRKLKTAILVAIISSRFLGFVKGHCEEQVYVNINEEQLEVPVPRIPGEQLDVPIIPKKRMKNNEKCVESICSLTTITIPSNVDQSISIENQLRKLLREEREKNKVLSTEYLQLQKQNVVLQTELQSIKRENVKLIEVNKKLAKSVIENKKSSKK